MRRLRFLLNSIILLTPILLLGIGAVRLVRGVFQFLNSNRRLAGTMSAEATRALGRLVRVGDVKITGNLWSLDAANRIDLIDVYIANGQSASVGAFARARRVSVWYNLRQVLANDRPLTPLVDEIALDSPEILLQRARSGRWNYQDLIRPEATTARTFTDKVTVTNGTVLYADAAFPHPPGLPERSLDTRLDRLRGVVLIRPDKSCAFDVAGAMDPVYMRDFHVNGSVVPSPLRIQARVVASQVALPSLASRLTPAPQLRVEAGHANIDAGILYAPPSGTPPQRLDTKALIAHGTVQIFDASASGKLVYAPVLHMNGLATFTTDSVLGNVTAIYAGMPVRLDGGVLGFVLPPLSGGQRAASPPAPPTLSVRGDIRRADWQRISRLAFIPGLMDRLPQSVRQDLRKCVFRGDWQFQAAGPVDDPETSLAGQITEAEYGGYRGENLDLRALYAGHVLHTSLQGRYAGGEAVVRGTVHLDTAGQFEAQAQGRGLDLARIGVSTGARLTGRGDLDFAIRGQNGRTPSITAQAEVDRVTINGQPFAHAYARADTSGPDLVVRTLTAEDKKGYIAASGTIGLKSRRLNLTVDADELDFGAIAKALSPPAVKSKTKTVAAIPTMNTALGRLADVRGFGYARTRLTGTLDKPSLEGKLFAYGVQTSAVELDKVTLSDFTVSRDEICIKGVASRYPGQIRVTGSVLQPFSRAPELKLDASVNELDLQTLLRLAGVARKDLVVTGTLSTDTIAVRGTLSSPQTPNLFNVNLQNATVNGIPIRNAALTMRYQIEGLYVKDASAQVADGLVVGSGWLPFEGPLSFSLHGEGLALQPLEEALSVSDKPDRAQVIVRGDLDFDASLSGTLKDPIVTAESISAANLVYNGFNIGSLKASGGYAERIARIDSLVLDVPNQTDQDQTEAGTNDGAIAVTALRRLTPFLPLGTPPAPKDGVIAINGLTVNLDTKQIRTEPSRPIRLDAIPVQRLHDLSYHLIENNNDDARKLLDDLRDVSGSISATVALAGTLDEPQADVTWSTAQIKAKNYEITSFTGSARIDRDRILYPSPQTPDLKFKIESPYVDIRSPADPRTKSIIIEFDRQGRKGLIRTIVNPGVKDPESVLADISASNINLQFLQQILDKSIASRIEGAGDVGITAHGRTTSPELEFTANLRKVAVYSAPDLRIPPIVLDRVELLDGAVKDGSIQIGGLRAIKIDPASGTSYVTSATAKLAGFSYMPPFLPPETRLSITGDLPVGFIAFAAPGLLRGTSTGGITLRADILNLRDNPSVSGEVDLNIPRLQLVSAATGIQDLKSTLLLNNDRLTIANFSAHTYIYSKPAETTGEAVGAAPARRGKATTSPPAVSENDPRRRGSEIQLTGSLPLGLRDNQPGGPNDGIIVRIFEPGEATASRPANGNGSQVRKPGEKQAALTFNEDPLPGSKTGVLRGSLRTDPNRPLRILGTVKEPVLRGRVTLFNALVTPPAEQKPGAFSLPILPSFDLALQLGSNVRLHTAQLDARLSTDRDIVAHGRLLQNNNDVTLEGTIQLSDGKLRLPTGPFTILPGATIHVNYPSYEGAEPVLGLDIDLQARGSVVAMSQSGVRKRYQVTVTAHGPVTGDAIDPVTGRQTLALSFETNPNDLASSQQLLTEKLAGAIIGVDSLDQAGRNPGQAFTNVLSSVFTGSVLPGVFDRTAASLGFEELSIGYDPIDRLTLNISRHLFGPLYVSYYRTLTATQERYDLKLSFRFRDRYQLSFDLDEQHTQKLLLEGVWKF